MPTLASGWTKEGLAYSIWTSDVDGFFRVELVNSFKEIWLLHDVKIVKENETFMCYFGGQQVAYGETFEKAANVLAEMLRYRLEETGAGIIRPVDWARLPEEAKVQMKEYRSAVGKVELVAYLSRSPVARALTPVRPKAPLTFRVPTFRPTLAPKKAEFGLGAEGRRRLRILFESTLIGLGIEPTRELKVRAEEIIYQLDSKYKAVPRSEAIEKAIVDLLDWIKDTIY